MKQTTLIVMIGVIGAAIAVVVPQIVRSSNNKQASPSSETYYLMGIEMTEEQAIEHCQVMPNMEGCAPFLK